MTSHLEPHSAASWWLEALLSRLVMMVVLRVVMVVMVVLKVVMVVLQVVKVMLVEW